MSSSSVRSMTVHLPRAPGATDCPAADLAEMCRWAKRASALQAARRSRSHPRACVGASRISMNTNGPEKGISGQGCRLQLEGRKPCDCYWAIARLLRAGAVRLLVAEDGRVKGQSHQTRRPFASNSRG